DVDVARVVELVAAELAHADHGKWIRRGNEIARRAHHVTGEGRDRCDRLGQRVESEEIARGDTQVLGLVAATEVLAVGGLDAVVERGENAEWLGTRGDTPAELPARSGHRAVRLDQGVVLEPAG